MLSTDGNNILGKMWILDGMRTAYRVRKWGHSTPEEEMKKDRNILLKYQAKLQSQTGYKDIQDQALSIYKLYGKGQDLQAVNDDLTAALKKNPDPNYWAKGKNRLWNESAASVQLVESIYESDHPEDTSGDDARTKTTEVDVATTWIVEKIRKANESNPLYKKGSEYGNLMNLSTLSERFLGRIQGGRNATPAQLTSEIGKVETQIQDAFNSAMKATEASLKECFKELHANANCPECLAKDDMTEFAGKSPNMAEIQKSLMMNIATYSADKLESELKGKMGDMQFDLAESLGISNGSVPYDTRSKSKNNQKGLWNSKGQYIGQ